ncbi:ribonuclease HI family protein [Leuconostoc citreum]|uniref:ribonuclease HI family protein n=1 Tax=Leuconostoc citreum TaxID=33964 RepID=UPI00051466BF|nr:ribonuclease HI family protein [Leuconostoc citreum]KAF0261087.1 RNase HI [Leuconostoc citreum]MBA5938341.1 ribonuclease HI family protein [Leuconostoc citreum]MBE4726335.1 ribonuclease HI family protein [Leuconostoc citreum]MCJ2166844.1 ribonuclease HI family protein [Leuconostoc citreum]MCT3058500.1 reverse transcriptase-like protein [Leuconostoc citreum]
MLTLYVDAAREPQSGISAGGAVLIHQKQQQQIKSNLFYTTDNHEAEFLALIWALKQVKVAETSETIRIFSDSKILIDSLDKKYAKHYQPLLEEIIQLLTPYSLVISQWLPEKENHGAHYMALQALKKNKRPS